MAGFLGPLKIRMGNVHGPFIVRMVLGIEFDGAFVDRLQKAFQVAGRFGGTRVEMKAETETCAVMSMDELWARRSELIAKALGMLRDIGFVLWPLGGRSLIT